MSPTGTASVVSPARRALCGLERCWWTQDFMDARAEMQDLERLFGESPYSCEFIQRQRDSKWGERIRREVVKGIDERRPASIEDGVLFLETNPRFFRSGYHKATVASRLKSAPLTDQQLARLRQVILAAAGDSRVGPEFNEYARLAIRVGNADFLGDIENRARSTDGWRRSRFERILSLCRKHRSLTNTE
jgi:hypothetical protein